jgi:hypothetical protein
VIFREAHFFACIWNSCIALACLISVMHELWLNFGWLVIMLTSLHAFGTLALHLHV